MNFNPSQNLDTLPDRMRDLPIGPNGFVVPWFVSWVNGLPEFRVADPLKWARAVKEQRCWVCGERLGSWLAFIIGPMCAINRITSEPACHLDCARWSVRNCPFLSRPRMVRREGNYVGGIQPYQVPGAIQRNPGVALLWVTRGYSLVRHEDAWLIRVGQVHAYEWYVEGRPATRAEVEESVTAGLPLLEKEAGDDPEMVEHLRRSAREVEAMYPAA